MKPVKKYRQLKRKLENKKTAFKDQAADTLSRFLVAEDFDYVKKMDVNHVEGEPMIKKAQPIKVEDEKIGNVENRKHVFVTDEVGNPLKFEIEYIEKEEILIWVYNTWKRDGSTQAHILFGNCKHSTINRYLQKFRVSAFDESAVAVYHLSEHL